MSDPISTFLTNRRVRTEAESLAEIERFLLVHESARFELVPPTAGMTDKWRAYFKHRPHVSPTSDLEPNPPVGVGSVMYIAIENLLRYTEGREPIDG